MKRFLVDHKAEKYNKFSARDMKKMWRTLKAEQGSNTVERSLPGMKSRSLTYWMNYLEDRLTTEIQQRPKWYKLRRKNGSTKN